MKSVLAYLVLIFAWWAVAVLAYWALALLAARLEAAPAPFPRRHARVLSASALEGTWAARWGNVPCTITLGPRNSYRCRWTWTTYSGSWGVDAQGRLWVTETNTPALPTSWRSYAWALDPVRLCGDCVEGDGPRLILAGRQSR